MASTKGKTVLKHKRSGMNGKHRRGSPPMHGHSVPKIIKEINSSIDAEILMTSYNILRQIRSILKTPEGENIIEHAKKIMEDKR